jgi:hypothetical protein
MNNEIPQPRVVNVLKSENPVAGAHYACSRLDGTRTWLLCHGTA